MTWFLTLTINGLLFITPEPFQSEEACLLAAKTAHVGECHAVEIPDPEQPD